MTLKGHEQLPKEESEGLADLFLACLLLHPARVGQEYGVHAQYVRQKYRDLKDPTKIDKKRVIERVTHYLQTIL